MGAAPRKLIRRKHLRDGGTPFDCLPWDLQRFVIDFLRSHLCEVTVENCQMVALALEYQVKQKGPLCPAELWVILENDIFFE